MAGLIDTKSNKLRLLRDDHDLTVFFYRECCNDLSGFISGLHVDDTDATAFCHAVVRHLGLLSKSLLGNRQDLLIAFFRNSAYRNDEIVLSQIYSSDTAGCTAHRTDIR